jgi:hypothetical protein
MNSLAELRRRKAELKAQIEQQSGDLKKTVAEIRTEFEPAQLLKKALGGVFGLSKDETNEVSPGVLNSLPAPLAFLADLLIKDPRLALLAKLIVPVALKYWPKRAKPTPETPVPGAEPAEKTEKTPAPGTEPAEKTPKPRAKNKLYGGLLRGVSALRSHLRRTAKEPQKTIEKPLEKQAEPIKK